MAHAPKVHIDHIETIAAEENIPADIMKTAAAITTAMPKVSSKPYARFIRVKFLQSI